MLNFKIIIPTLNAVRYFPFIEKGILSQQGISKENVIFIDSSSEDGTDALAEKNGFKVLSIPLNEFNHGGTRQLAADYCKNADILIYMTQDAYLADPESICRILACFSDPKTGAVCGRQLPHEDANPLATHARYFNYPDQTVVKGQEDIAEMGIKVPFLSNSFAAYRCSALMEVGGFPHHVILAEDVYIGAKIVLAGYKIIYSAETICFHSHNYTPLQEFKRYFDIGVFHARESWISNTFGHAGGEGVRYIKSELGFVWPNFYWLIRSIVTSSFKFIGYQLGKKEKWIPVFFKKKLSMHKQFWNTELNSNK